ncbi:MAG: hypothetical protein ACE5IP_11265 [Terriglobia bacterium]
MIPPPPAPSGSSSAFVFFGDAPPPGSTILKFEITLSSAVLCPDVSMGQCQGTPQVSLISEPVEIELKELELESAFLSLVSVPEGTYNGVQLTFANPELKILLNDGSPPQELEAPDDFALNPAMITPTFPGGLTVSADTSFGFLVDFNIFDSIVTDPMDPNDITTISPMVNLVELPAIGGAEIEELEDVTGKVANLMKTCPTGTFTLIESITGRSIDNINFNEQTEFDPDEGVVFTCADLANDQIVEVDLELRASNDLTSATFFAEEIEFVEPPDEDELEGPVFQVNSATEFVLLVREAETVLGNVPIGSFVTITLSSAPATEFRIDQDDLPLGPGLSFASGDDLLAGQKVEVDVLMDTLVVPGASCAEIADGCSATAEKIKLKKTTFTARVDALNDPNFTLADLPSIFVNPDGRPLSADCPAGPPACSITEILVSTSAQTEFRDTLTNFGDLAVDDIVTVRGLLFKNGFAGPAPGTGMPELVARRVRRREP